MPLLFGRPLFELRLCITSIAYNKKGICHLIIIFGIVIMRVAKVEPVLRIRTLLKKKRNKQNTK